MRPMSVPNVLANRYASKQMRDIWAPEAKIVSERRLWLAVLRAQRDLGVDFGGDDADKVIADYERVVDDIDLGSIADRERVTRHDVKARIEEFNALAGHEQIHKGMTSRDLTENVEHAFGTRDLSQIRGIVERAPITAALMVIGFLALAGFPPFAMFISEFGTFVAAFAAGSPWWLRDQTSAPG